MLAPMLPGMRALHTLGGTGPGTTRRPGSPGTPPSPCARPAPRHRVARLSPAVRDTPGAPPGESVLLNRALNQEPHLPAQAPKQAARKSRHLRRR